MNISDFPIELKESTINIYYPHIRFVNNYYNTYIKSIYYSKDFPNYDDHLDVICAKSTKIYYFNYDLFRK